MLRSFIIITLATLALSTSGIAQPAGSTSPTPTPTPVKRRPMLDQFSIGVFASPGQSTPSTAVAEPVGAVEYVDQNTFEVLTTLTEKAAFLETELSRVVADGVDISPSSRFRKYFEHNIEGIRNVSAAQRTGAFGGAGIKGEKLTKLLLDNERAAIEILAVLDAGAAEYARFSTELNTVSKKYDLPLLDSPSAGTRLDKPALLKAIMARMNSNYARLKRQMSVRQ